MYPVLYSEPLFSSAATSQQLTSEAIFGFMLPCTIHTEIDNCKCVFRMSAPTIYNTLMSSTQLSGSLATFKCQLKRLFSLRL